MKAIPVRCVLLVEDEAIVSMALAFSLEMAGYKVTEAPNGRAALAKLAGERPDVIITDYMMPLMDGSEFLRAIRANPELRDVPVILATAIPEENLAGKIDGYSAYLTKPVRDDELIALIERLLEESSEPK